MDQEKDYEGLLSNIYDNLPTKGISSGERFEIPKFESFVEGVKTVVKNFTQVCDKIRRDKEFISKLLSKELAVPVEVQGDRLILHRKLSSDMLQKKLDDLVLKYVMCRQCKKPDTHINETAGIKQLVCEACGARNTIR